MSTFLDGTTFHSALGFKVGTSICHLGTKKMTEMKHNLAGLKLLIIDEVSLVGADMLYRIHLRLTEIFETEENVPFGNVSVMLVGDLLQLPPVMGNHVFRKPINDKLLGCHDGLDKPLWDEFEPIVLRHNHRQGESKEWANSLNRFREGIVTPEDDQKLRSRITKDTFLQQNAMHTFYLNKKVNKHNETMMHTLKSDLITCKALHALPKNRKPWIKKGKDTIGNTEFMDIFQFKVGARCFLVKNIDLIDDMFNGASGTIVGVEFNEKEEVICIIVQFDNELWGRNQRLKYPGYAAKYKSMNGTPIFRVEAEYFLSRGKWATAAQAKLLQFPLRLNYAQTCHKMQVIYKIDKI